MLSVLTNKLQGMMEGVIGVEPVATLDQYALCILGRTRATCLYCIVCKLRQLHEMCRGFCTILLHYSCIVCLTLLLILCFSMCRLKESREQQFRFCIDHLMLWRALQLIACILVLLVTSWSTGLINIAHQHIASTQRYCEKMKLLHVRACICVYITDKAIWW